MYGTAKTGKDDNMQFLAADVPLVASGVAREASGEQLKEFIISKGIDVVSVEKLTRDDVGARTNTLKVVVKLTDYEKAMNPEIWPYRVGVRHYKPPRRNGISWQQQTSQGGGHVNQDVGQNRRQMVQNSQQSQSQASSQSLQRTVQQTNRDQGNSSNLGETSAGSGASPFQLNLQNRYSVLATADQNGDVFLINN